MFRYVLRLTLKWPWLSLLIALGSVLASLGITKTYLEFSTDRTQLLDPGHPIQTSFRQFRDEFGGNTDMVVLVVGNSVEVRLTVDQLGKDLEEDKEHFRDVLYRIDMPEVARHSLYFLSLQDLQNLHKQTQDLKPWLPSLKQGLPGLVQELSTSSDERALPLLRTNAPTICKVLEGVLESLKSRGEAPYRSPLPVFLPEAKRLRTTSFKPGQTSFYNTIGDKACLVIASPADRSGSFAADTATIARLRQKVARVVKDHPTVNCLVSGEPVINTDEMVGARGDAIRCGLTALGLVGLILALAFGSITRPLCAVFSMLIGLSWSFAFAALTVGTLNLLTVHFATILVGLSMTFAISLLSHYQELRSKDPEGQQNPAQILEKVVTETGLQTLVGALTTAVAFWTLHFTNFRAAGELGLITGTGVLLTFVSIWTIFPVLVCKTESKKPVNPLRIPGFETLGRAFSRYTGWVLLVSTVITAYSATWINRVPFNYNVLSLQEKGSDSVRVERLLQSLGYSTLYAVCTAESAEEAAMLARRLEKLPTVAHVESVTDLMPQNVAQKQLLVEQILGVTSQIDSLPTLDDFWGSGQKFRTAAQLIRLRSYFNNSAPRLGGLIDSLPDKQERQCLKKSLKALSAVLENESPGPLETGLREYESKLSAELEEYRLFLQSQLATPPDIVSALPQALRIRSISAGGNYSIRVFPRADSWEREPLERFVSSLERVDKGVTGTPSLIFYYLEELRIAYSSAGTNALLVIAVLLLIHYRSILQAGLAIFPKLLGVVWMLGIMGVCGQSFNAANFLALPITLGIGLVFGVSILSECHRGGVKELFASATGGAVFLSGVVATTGFACFALANHKGVASFGFVMAAGVGANILTSLGTLPALLGFWKQRRPQ